VALPLSTLFEAPTIRALAALLGEDPAHPEAPASARMQGYVSLVPMQQKGARPPFYCAAGMHGNPLNLRLLAAHSGPDQPFYGLQPQGLDGSTPLHRSVPEMAAHYVGEVRRHQPRGPYYLGGYSGGGIVAFEMARQLAAAGELVGALVLLDAPAPTLPLRSHVERLRLHLSRLEQMGSAYPARVAAQVLDAKLGRVKLLAQRRLSRVLPELRFRFRLEEIADAWYAAAGSYRPSGYEGPALLLRAEAEGSQIPGTARILDHQNGWGAYVLGGLEVRDVPGDHTTMCEEPNVRVLARHLRAYLDRCMSARRTPSRAHPSVSAVAE
jgi:thioesterase domain-containing protein